MKYFPVVVAGANLTYDYQGIMSGDANSSNIPPAICSALPSDLAAINITETSADLEWTMNGVSSDVEWGIAGFELGTGNYVAGATSPLPIAGLTGGTSYDFYVRDRCSDGGIGTWVGPASFTNTPPTYCDAFTTSAQDEYIGNVTCGSINNTTGWQSGVANYTAISTAIAAGSSEAIAVTNSGGAYGTSDYVTVWVDWGADFVFDQGGDEEFLLTNDGTGINFSGSILVPVGTPAGTYTMRVRLSYASAPPPCGSTSWGETEDYSIVVP